MRKTKIVCTLGPATDSIDTLKQLFNNGMNVARLNFSHGNHEEHKKTADKVKKIREDMGVPLALLLDTKGPEIRIKEFENDRVELKEGNFFTLTTKDVPGNESIVSVTYDGIAGDVNRGDRILIDDGLIELKVINKSRDEVECEIINGGVVKNRKGVNIPGVFISLPFISEKDKSDLLFAIENDFDYIAASFVRDAESVKAIKNILEENNGDSIKVIAKIENRDGERNIDEIIRVSDGIMVARGDMGVEIPFEELPAIQKKIIKKCYLAGKPVITATQMLDSMIRNPRPTRAEITDVANAIYDGTSAIMLSGETSIGDYPLESVATMSKIAIETERNIDYVKMFNLTYLEVSRNVTNAISHSTCLTAHNLDASAIITITKSGHTAKMVSKYRPRCSIIATTFSNKAFQQLALTWGVYPILTGYKSSTDDIFAEAIHKSIESRIIKNGDLIVITGGMQVGVSGTTNMLKVHIVGDVLLEGKGIDDLPPVSGNVCVAEEDNETLKYFHVGDILVISKSTDEILHIIKNASAIITEEDSKESKAAVVGKALEIPVLTNVDNATDILKSGIVVTVDSSKGFVYNGVIK